MQQPAPLYFKQASYGLLTSFVAMVSALYSGRPNAFAGAEKLARPVLINRQFRKLLSHEFKTRKSPAEYAEALNISLTYLNEVVKKTTGFAVSYWIHMEIVLEAKRLLYHSESSVKEIAYALGYDDPAYFARLFKRMVSVTPGDFRRSYRE
jgi:AraC-like DNA-binding protein